MVSSSNEWPEKKRAVGRATVRQAGFTLLELVMVMTILVILAAISVASYQQIQTRARETILKQDLNTMRKLIDQYQADKERLPSSLDDLVTAGYLRELPIDPFTEQADWVPEMGEDTVSRTPGAQGVIDVHSNAAGTGSDGVPYGKY